MKTALVTGANKGIGFEVVRRLAEGGYYVYLGSRNPENGRMAVEKLKADGVNNIEAVLLDVASPASIAHARNLIGEKTATLDVLINNAAIGGPFQQSALASRIEQYKEVFESNLFGVINVTQAFIDLLKNSPAPRIVNVSTAMASLTMAADLHNAAYPVRYAIYQTSKTALNMYTLQLAYELRDTSFKVNMVCPGWTKTDFTAFQGTSTVQEASQRIVKYAIIGEDGPTGKFISEEYFPDPASCPW